jgi:phosphate starvation-inducible PhoH-like protein
MEVTIQVASHEEAILLFGLGDRNLKLLRDAFDVRLTGRGQTLKLRGEKAQVEEVAGLLNGMLALFRGGAAVAPEHLERAIEKLQGLKGETLAGAPGAERIGMAGDEGNDSPPGDGAALARVGAASRPAAPVGSRNLAKGSTATHSKVEDLSGPGLARSVGQNEYIQSIQNNEIVFCIGPAGTGKTFLAVYMAVGYLKQGLIRKIFLCRPAVEAGEKLGFLPGDFQAKINPYLRPLYDALNDILDYDQFKRYLEREIIEILPLAYMRGRTLNNAFIILDEGQNTSVSQMKMFLTRMGMNSRIVVNGDITQVDLPEGMPSGLIHARKVIRNIPGISWVQMQKGDIVRHPLVRRIVEAYEEAEAGTR